MADVAKIRQVIVEAMNLISEGELEKSIKILLILNASLKDQEKENSVEYVLENYYDEVKEAVFEQEAEARQE